MYFFKIGEVGVIVLITKLEIGHKFNEKIKRHNNIISLIDTQKPDTFVSGFVLLPFLTEAATIFHFMNIKIYES